MKWKYKTVMFLILLIFCAGNVSAIDPDNNTTGINTIVSDNLQLNNTILYNFDDVNSTETDNSTLRNVNSDLNESFNSPLNLDTIDNNSIGEKVFNMMINPTEKEKIHLHYVKKLDTLTNEIVTKLNNIDHVIDSNLNITITQLERKTALLNKINYASIKNGLINDSNTQLAIKESDRFVRILKSIDCSIKSITGHVKAIIHYVNTIDDFRLIKSMLNNESKDIDNTTVVYLKGRVNDLSVMTNNLNAMRLYIGSIIDDLNSIIYVMNQQIKNSLT